jgi:branched-chain amino acid transport system substrate-binding protein
MNRKVVALVAALALLVATVAGIVWFRFKPGGRQAIRIGTVLDLTGAGASYGEKMRRGFGMAVDEANAAGGIGGRSVELVVEDFQWDPGKALTAFRKLTSADGIGVIVGITGSKHAIPVAAASRSDNVVIIDALTSSPKLTTDGGPNYFRVMPSDAMAGQFNVEWALGAGMKKPGVVYVEDDWGVSYRDTLRRYLTAKGLTNVPVYGVTSGTRDLRAQVQSIRQDDPDSLFLLVYAQEGGAFTQQLRQAGVRVPIYGSDNLSAPEFIAVGAEVIEGVRVALPATAKGAIYDGFARRCRDRFGDEPDAILLKSYDAMNVALHVISEVGDDPARIRDRLHSSTFAHEGITGEIRFDAHGDLVTQAYTKMIYRSGKLGTFE